MWPQVAFLDSARDFVGAAAKSLGLAFNASVADMTRCGVSEERLQERCRALRGQVRVFSNAQLFAALSGRDVWAVVGPAAEAMAVAKRYYDVRVVAPLSGTTLAAHVWTQPADLGGAHCACTRAPVMLQSSSTTRGCIDHPVLCVGADEDGC